MSSEPEDTSASLETMGGCMIMMAPAALISVVICVGFGALPLLCSDASCVRSWFFADWPYIYVSGGFDAGLWVIWLLVRAGFRGATRVSSWPLRLLAGIPVVALGMMFIAGGAGIMHHYWTQPLTYPFISFADAVPTLRDSILFGWDQVLSAFAGDAWGVFFSEMSSVKIPNENFWINALALGVRLTTAFVLAGGLITLIRGAAPKTATDRQ